MRQRLSLSDQRRHKLIQGFQFCTVYLWLASGFCVSPLGHGVCLLGHVVRSVAFALSSLCTDIAYIGRLLQNRTWVVVIGAANGLAVDLAAGEAQSMAVWLPA